MTQFDPTPDPIGDWHRLVEALEDIVQAEPADAGASTPEELKDVRRLLALRLAAFRRDSLPAFWVRRGRVATGPDIGEPPEARESDEAPPRPPDPAARPRTPWRE